jgi:hypothetical protein
VARVTCKLCETRPARRFCPGSPGDICTVCCGTERENTIECPFDCEYLQEARKREKRNDLDEKSIPNKDIRVSEEFLTAQQPLLIATGRMLFAAAVETEGAIDYDVRDALGSLIRTFRTMESGLVYETRPANAMAGAIQAQFQEQLQKLREDVAHRTGLHSVRDKDILSILAFWERMELQVNNGRRRGRAFIDSLISLMAPPEEIAGQ